MKVLKHITIFLILASIYHCLYGQKNDVVFGFHLEPIIPNRMFRIQAEDIDKEDVSFSVIPQTGYLFGSHLSFQITNKFTIESGINIVQRKIEMVASEQHQDVSMNYKIHNFEIPLASTFFVRLSEKIYMGQTVGVSFQLLPSHLISSSSWVDSSGTLSKFQQISYRRNWLVPSFKGSVGFEYRSENDGYFYFGGIYHLFTKMYTTQISYKTSTINELFDIYPQSDFFGIIFRYSFPPTQLKINKKKKKT